MADFIPVNEPLLNGNEKRYLAECIETGWISSEGPFVQKFEQLMSAAVGRKYGIAVCNGTAALETVVAALELQPGDEVIMPTFTIISCAAALVRRGCIPVLVDSDPETWNMDVSQIGSKITSRTTPLKCMDRLTKGGPAEALAMSASLAFTPTNTLRPAKEE
jgi:perosamine synthetase